MITSLETDGDTTEQRLDTTALNDDLRYNPTTGLYYVSHDLESDRELSTTVIGAIAAVAGVDVAEVAPLSETFDPDALDALFRETDCEDGVARLTFVHEDQRVSVYATGDIAVRP